MESIHDDAPKRIVTYGSRVAHFPGSWHKDYKSGLTQHAADFVQLSIETGDKGSRCVVTCPARLPTVFERRILFILLERAQRTKNPTVQFSSAYELIKATGKHPTNELYDATLDALFLWANTEMRYYGIKRPRSQFCGRGREDEPERENIFVLQVFDRLEYDFKTRTGPVRVKLNRDYVKLHSRDRKAQVAELDLDVLARLRAPAAQNLYIYLMAYPERNGSRQPLSVQTLVRVCAWSNQRKSASELDADLQRTLDSISKATGTAYRFEKTRNGTYRIVGAEPALPDAVSPGVRVTASNDADVKPEPRQRVRLVA